MDWYEKELLARAVDESADLRIVQGDDQVQVVAYHVTFLVGVKRYFRPTLADALTALLSDLGEEVVPEPPSAEQIAAWDRENEQLVGGTEGVRSMRQWFAVAPLDCIAWLEGGEA